VQCLIIELLSIQDELAIHTKHHAIGISPGPGAIRRDSEEWIAKVANRRHEIVSSHAFRVMLGAT
jgi:hypothetical protein